MRLTHLILLTTLLLLTSLGGVAVAASSKLSQLAEDPVLARTIDAAGTRFLRTVDSTDKYEGATDLAIDDEERTFGALTKASEFVKNKVGTQYWKNDFKDLIRMKETPSTLYLKWGFGLNGLKKSDPRYRKWHLFRDYYYKLERNGKLARLTGN
ncbi:hypothetical protein PHYBOEH_000366 [Phytophthora boehmeriae]|uniref:RxLR effector protein n=1 Tax=Phytophthora boehmeriae TaxID=109152 RepID=A0A8T1X1R8_9STRA|nr:hypothetical protein PHYBOEH_000366 [Phytophthora boehmeriae]